MRKEQYATRKHVVKPFHSDILYRNNFCLGIKNYDVYYLILEV